MAEFGRAYRAWRRFLKRTLVGTGITLPQLDVLRALAANGRLHPSEIAVLLDCDRPTVSIMLGRMTGLEWVVVTPNPHNLKYRDVRLASGGSLKLAEIDEMLGLPGRSRFDPLGCLDDGERAALVATLDRLVAHAEGAPWTGVPDGARL